ncbi:MAG: polysaccharide biosynthesis protein [Bryobacteraceae bacterium]
MTNLRALCASAVNLPLLRALPLLLRFRAPLARLAHLALFLLAGALAFTLRFDFHVPLLYLPHLSWALWIWPPFKLLVFELFGLNRGQWRYVSVHDLFRLGAANVAGSLAGAAAILCFAPRGFPRSIYLLDLLLCFLFTAGLRVVVRVLIEASRRPAPTAPKSRALIYGAGEAGLVLLREIRGNPALPYAVLGLIDDDPAKQGLPVHGTKVLGRGEALARLVPKLGVETVLIAIPSATGQQMTRILRLCQEAGVAYKTVPGLAEVIEGNGLARQIRDVAVEDLLGRTPVNLDESALRLKLEGRVVLVTGAAGSIGAELCRQIARFHPSAIVAFEIAETPLFELEREMRQAFPGVPFHPEIGSIQNPCRLDEVFRLRRPALVFHAAAYKHVPLMESHVFEAIENNVFGTYNVGLAAAQHGVDDFVLVSSDKAVRPANVMGATKRLAELVVLSLQNGRTRFVAVRFGNVLGSSGSVVPIFKQQIAAGGPVTVTHPEMRRFFMTTREAVQLVLQASTMGAGGEIFVLDMGEPVKIVDLARNLILLSGLRPDQDIRIEFTSIRPGEKLYEELSTLLEDTLPTSHEKIRVFAGNGLPEQSVTCCLAELRETCALRDLARAVLTLKDIIPEYNPSAWLLRRALDHRSAQRAVATA